VVQDQRNATSEVSIASRFGVALGAPGAKAL
jgi:hypothetical protein